MRCDKCGKKIGFWLHPLWNSNYPCPHCSKYQEDARIDNGGCKVNPNDPGPYSGEIKE